MSTTDEWMRAALVEARLALASGDVPVAALVLDAAGTPIGIGHNERELTGDPTAYYPPGYPWFLGIVTWVSSPLTEERRSSRSARRRRRPAHGTWRTRRWS